MRRPAIALAGAAVLLAFGGLVCWQQAQLSAVRRQSAELAAQVAAAADGQKLLAAQVAGDDRALRVARTEADLARAELVRLQALQRAKALRLQGLLAERTQAIADAHDAAHTLRIREGTREMRLAVAAATADLDNEIVMLAGAATAQSLGVAPVIVDTSYVEPARPAPYVPVYPAPTYPLSDGAGPGSGAIPVSAANDFGSPSNAAGDTVAADSAVVGAVSTPALVGIGGFARGGGGARGARGAGADAESRTRAAVGAAVRGSAAAGKTPKLSATQAFTASAGIPMVPVPTGKIVATDPILLEKQHGRVLR